MAKIVCGQYIRFYRQFKINLHYYTNLYIACIIHTVKDGTGRKVGRLPHQCLSHFENFWVIYMSSSQRYLECSIYSNATFHPLSKQYSDYLGKYCIYFYSTVHHFQQTSSLLEYELFWLRVIDNVLQKVMIILHPDTFVFMLHEKSYFALG